MELEREPLWTRENVDKLKRDAYVFRPGWVALPHGAGPADGLQAARELLGKGATFHGINPILGHPTYTTDRAAIVERWGK